jgi:hypothetical protein
MSLINVMFFGICIWGGVKSGAIVHVQFRAKHLINPILLSGLEKLQSII